MAHRWPLIPLVELVDPTRGISYGIVQPGQHEPDGIPIIRAGDLRGDRIDVQSPLRVSKVIEANYSRTRLRGGELVMSIVGTVGQTAIVDEQFMGWNTARAVAVIPVRPEIGAYWVSIALKTPVARERIDSRLNTTVQATLNLRDVAELPVALPPLTERRAIASVLGALDDKIELNRRMNETLETMARAIFRDWFVDFGPTCTKIKGLAPYLAPEIWSLFPDQLNDEGMPEGWSVGRVSEIIDFGPHEPLKKGVVAPYLDMAAVPTKGPTPDVPILREFGSGTRFRNGDTLLARITPCLENGKTAYVENLPADTIGWGSTEFIVMRSRSPVPSPVSYLIAREPGFRQAAIQSMTGTSGRQRANADAISEFPVTLPSNPKVWTTLSEILDPIFAKIRANAVESQTLAVTRDLLLPKLMSGEIRVKDAERLAETTSPEEIAERLL